MRPTLADAKDASSGISRVLNLDPSDDRFVSYVNESMARLITRMKSWGTVTRYQICVTNGCITWPREVAAIEAVAVCNAPITIRNGWFEFLENGPGLQGNDVGCGLQLIDRGRACVFSDIIGINKKIKVYADVAESATARILLLGYDENYNWIRTETGPGSGVWQDGEYVLISTTPQTSVNFFSKITDDQKPITNGFVRLYEYDTVLLTQRAIAVYEPDETRPDYPRSVIPGLSQVSGGACETKTVTAQVKLDFIPARNDTDFLVIPNLPAIKEMCQSIRKSENNLFQEAEAWEMRARKELNFQLNHYTGSGVVQPVRLPRREVFGAGVLNMQ